MFPPRRVCINRRYDISAVPAGSPCPECGSHDFDSWASLLLARCAF